MPTWTFTWSYRGVAYNAIFVGKPPITGKSTTIPVYIIPIKLTYGTFTTDPTAVDASGNSPVTNTLNSPIFNAGIDWKQGRTDLGNTQFVDAFQRGNLWGTVSTHPGYHVLFGTPTVEPVQSVTVPSKKGTTATAFGNKVIVANINWFDPIITGYLSSLKIPANSLPIFITTQAYLSGNSGTSECCIGGYHSFTGTQAYSHFTYISNSSSTQAFAQDVSALSHEASEWMDDPMTNNTNVPCSIYEVGDPLELLAFYGTYPYVLNGFTYHLQDEVMPTYFGAPGWTSMPFHQSFEGDAVHRLPERPINRSQTERAGGVRSRLFLCPDSRRGFSRSSGGACTERAAMTQSVRIACR